MHTFVSVKVRLWLYVSAAVSAAILMIQAVLTLAVTHAATWGNYLDFIPLAVLLAATSVAVLSAVWNARTGRKLSRDIVFANDRLRLAMESGKTVAWDWDVQSGRDVWFGDLKTMFGISGDVYEGQVEDFRRRVHPDDREPVWRAVADARLHRTPYRATFRVVWADGTTRWVTASGKFYYAANGEAVRMAGIAADITERKEIEDKLRESQERLTGIVTSAMDAIIAVDDQQRIVVFNAAAEKMLMCTETDAIGSSVERFIPERFRVAYGGHIERLAETRVTGRSMSGLLPLWALRTDGEEFPIEASVSQIETRGRKLFTIILRDMTERRRTEAALRESEERFRRMSDTAPVMLWMSGTDALCNYFNRPWLEFTGRSIEMELGNGWVDGVHPDDMQRCLETYIQAFDRREPFRIEYRLRRDDGDYRWVLHTGVPRFAPDSSFSGYIGSAIDVTDHKVAQAALSSLSRRLIQAHEEERTWIARELHDDVIQRLSLLTMELESLSRLPLEEPTERRNRVQKLSRRMAELARDVQGISHRLHSSKLEYLGIASAAEGVCKEMSEQQQVEIEFSHADVPDELPQEISLSLFRVLQEALHNAVKHAGVRHFAVALRGTQDDIQLEVVDTGVGFDAEAAMRSHGLGLISMRERLNLVKGEISIESRPGHGTRISARVPFRSEGYLHDVVQAQAEEASTDARAPL